MAIPHFPIELADRLPLRVVPSPASVPAASASLPLPNGESVVVLALGEETVVELRDGDERPRFRFNVNTGQLDVEGNVRRLSVSATGPEMRLASTGDLCLEAEGRVRLRGGAGVELEAAEQGDRPTARARVASSSIQLEAQELSLLGQRGRFRIGQLDLTGDRWRAALRSTELAAARVELRAQDLRSKVRSVVQEIETTLSLRAGRVRQWIAGTHHTRSHRTEIRADEDVRIDGKSIHLG